MLGRQIVTRTSEPISGRSGRIRSIQRGSSSGSASSTVATSTSAISSVDPAKARAEVNGGGSTGGAGTSMGVGVRVASSTTVQWAAKSANGAIGFSFGWQVVEEW